jgi:hypothetical protein
VICWPKKWLCARALRRRRIADSHAEFSERMGVVRLWR